ncbi:hypothetical protein SPRG_18884 [Saprolegnia parasitica CBS 223.65]|uniref:Kinesin-like protein n=1 Tax=Saprolegnia parasitica (strain CBS 223.65) TaxID=695850 RepID=A0A067CZ41_SAPPC|nr:hypothetical protein SPRG_18884 [Saprolegnia parasitica CBS 223.65]KDO35738.1 hypothetical protein SPRG_18884 [Saprolegnia parasitica CBS 223.65]|eukprot:XP_012194098.1 hypothetical protein SPRG_18884 [Saprolegnia parasitica CBS 223.65]
MAQRTPRAVSTSVAWSDASSPSRRLHRANSMSPVRAPTYLQQASPLGSLTSRRDGDQRRATQAGLSLLGLAFDGVDAAPLSPTSSMGSYDHGVEGLDPHLFLEGVKEHARYLGMDPDFDADFLWIAKESLVAPVPAGWHQVMTSEGAPYYYNDHTGESRWEHPSDRDYIALFQEIRRRQHSGEPVDVVALKHQMLAPPPDETTWPYASQSSWGYDATSPASSHANLESSYHDYSESDVELDENAQVPLQRKKSSVALPSPDEHRELLEKLHAEICALKATIAQKDTDLAAAQARADGLASAQETTAAALAVATAREAQLVETSGANQVAVADLDEALRTAKQQIVVVTAELELSKSKVAQENQELRQQVTTLSMRVKELEAGSDHKDELKRYERKLANLTDARDALQQELDALTASTAAEIQSLKDAAAMHAEQHTSALADTSTAALAANEAKIQALELQHQTALATATAAIATEKANVTKLLGVLESEKKTATAALQAADVKATESAKEVQMLQAHVTKYKTKCKQLEASVAASEAQLKSLTEDLAASQSSLDTKLSAARQAGADEAARTAAAQVQAAIAEKDQLALLYAQEMKARRQLHNKVMELGGNIRVFCRVRPIQPVELQSDAASEAVFFRPNDTQALDLVVGEGQKHIFEFDHVFTPSSSQTDVFEQTKALVVSAMDGFNVCIFAYGQTGSGKTHTMEGPDSDRGVNFRAMQELFRVRDDRLSAGTMECDMKLSILEVYNETIVDLLDDTSTGDERKTLEVRMGKHGAFVDNLMEVEVASTRDVEDLMRLGHSHRSVGGHDFNEHSSRSHLVLSITITSVQKADGKRAISKLHLIDLAGSERISKTAASGQRLKEAQHINRSLSSLGDVIAALGSHSKHVPYRNSKLTFLLQESLSGNSKVLMFVNVSPVAWNAWESLCSLNFAQRCRSVALKGPGTQSPAKALHKAPGSSTEKTRAT